MRRRKSGVVWIFSTVAPSSSAVNASACSPSSMTSAVAKRSRSCVRRCARWNPASAPPPERKNRCSRRKNASSTCCCRGVSRLAGKQFFLSPLLEEPFPEGAASAEVRAELLPVAQDEIGGREGPDVCVARLAQDLAQQPNALSLGPRPQASLNVAHGEGVVPREVRDDLWIRHVGAEEVCAGHGGDPTTRRENEAELHSIRAPDNAVPCNSSST